MAFLAYSIQGMRHEFKLRAAEVTIGRAEDCSLQLPDDAELSRRHCCVKRQGQSAYVLMDANSRNGTFLNGGRLTAEPAALTDGDEISIGRTKLIFRDQEAGTMTTMLRQVEGEMEGGKGFGTIMREIVRKK